jgi:hypothetical protein
MQHESTHADHYRATAKDCEERAASAPDPETRRVYEEYGAPVARAGPAS